MFERKHWIVFFVVIVLLLMILAVPVGGRKASQISAPTEKTFSGKVEAVNQHTCEIFKCVEISATLKTGAGLPEIRLGVTGRRLPPVPVAKPCGSDVA